MEGRVTQACIRCGTSHPEADVHCPYRLSPERNNPGYTPEYKELEEARRRANRLLHDCDESEVPPDFTPNAIRWLAAEVRVMRLERALER